MVEIFKVLAFSDSSAGGNAAGVVLNADNLTPSQRLQIAAKVGFSETAFLSTPKNPAHDYDIRFFTPAREIDNCGHATIAAFSLLRQQGLTQKNKLTYVNNQGEGSVEYEGPEVYMAQKAATYETLSGDEIEFTRRILGYPFLDPKFTPQIVSTGNRFLVVGVDTEKELTKLQPLQSEIYKISEEKSLIGIYVFVLKNPKTDGVYATTRMFAPYYGIDEESATGMAAGPLAGLLFDHKFVEPGPIVIEQGRFMNLPAPSQIKAEFQIGISGKLEGLRVGGRAYIDPKNIISLDL